MKPAISIFSKIKFILLLAFTLSLLTTAALQITKDRQLVHEIIETYAKATAETFFDSLNVMMLTGTISQKDVLVDKYLNYPDIVNLEVLRTANFIDLDGVPQPEFIPRDNYDKRALKGEYVSEVFNSNGTQHLLVTQPIYASSMDRGTNCLSCHPVAEGTLMGSIRVEYDLSKVYNVIGMDIFQAFLVNFLILTCTLVVTTTLLYRIMLRPLKRITQGMESAIDQKDLNFKITYDQDNELGRFAQAFNQLLEAYRRDQISIRTLQEKQDAEAEQSGQPLFNISGEALKLSRVSKEVIDAISRFLPADASEIRNDYRTHASVDLLRSITDQASLIALNTSIELMRLGDTGDIAEEVRISAMQTSEVALDILSRLNELESQLPESSRSDELEELLKNPANRLFHTFEVLGNHLNQCSTMFTELCENTRVPRPAYVHQEQVGNLEILLDNTRKLLQISSNLMQNPTVNQK